MASAAAWDEIKTGRGRYMGLLRDGLPRFITDPGFVWSCCPFCDYPPAFRHHFKAKYYKEYRNQYTCACGRVGTTLTWWQSRKRDVEPWYIRRLWRRQGYCGDGHGHIREYTERWDCLGTYPISQHIEEMLTIMPIDMRVGIR